LFKEAGYSGGTIGLPCIDGAIDSSRTTVVGPRTEFLDIVPERPGREHDSRIFQNSRVYIRYRQQALNGMLVGDAGYPALPFLLTPIANPITDEEIRYNLIHSRTRRIVERTFDIWKIRFSSCLSRGLSTKLVTSTTIVVACAIS
ncbi:Putative nuclease HARBI1, partial [Cyphomyrmex costatus]